MKYGLIGEKLGHSFSKSIQEELFGYEYELKEVAPIDFKQFILNKDFLGVNITIPYKEIAISLCDELDVSVQRIGSLNTIVNKNGKLIGYNTDYDGLKFLMSEFEIDLFGKNVVILGSGGTSKTARELCKDLGANKIWICSRRKEEGYISYDTLAQVDFDVLINTTPLGMYPNSDLNPIIDRQILKDKVVIDVIFNPLQTRLVVEAKRQGVAVGGLLMLVAQAAKAGAYFIGQTKTREEINHCYQTLKGRLKNIVLIGMPSSGKSTIGRILSQKLKRKFVDIDTLIAEEIGMSVQEIFIQYGESYFRKLESEKVAEVSTQFGLVIATGGGVVLENKNLTYLKQNGEIILLKRDIDLIEIDENRPLLKDKLEYKKLYLERKQQYEASMDICIENNDSIEEAVRRILEVL